MNHTAPNICIHADYGNPFKVHAGREISIDNVLKKISDPYLLFQIERVSSFHGYLSTGAFIGIQMLNIAKRALDADYEEQLYVTCETYNCLPDPFQILAGCTIGNKKLKIRDFGKMAVVVKAAGAALLSGRDLSDCALVTTGRLSGGMVAKAARAGIPIIVSKAAPLSTGVELSKRIGMTLVAFVRKPNLYVYPGGQRIV